MSPHAGRLVVTGHDDDRRAVFVHDGEVAPVDMLGAGSVLPYWSADEIAEYPNPGDNPGSRSFFPPPRGARFFTMVLTPRGGPGRRAATEPGALGSDLAASMEHDNPGMHRSDSTDFAVVTSGSVVLELDDGAKVQLSAGDAVVQNGTRHRWRLVGEEPAVVTFVMVGARRNSLA